MPIQYDQRIFDALKDRLSKPLPGKEVQYEMSAFHHGKGQINFNFEFEPKESSVLITLFLRNGQICFPLIQRPQYSGIHSGQIGLPGGKVEKRDKDKIDTALRETEEEIGVSSSDIIVLGGLTELFVQASHYNVVPIVGYLPYEPEYRPDPKEVSRVIEGRVDDLLDDKNKKVKDLLVRGKYFVTAPYFDLNHEIIWGATAMILNEFSAVLKDIIK
jgi:8-oxo-dGTP pyrophosphatase MutT (NUDIX family)